jgi:WD40 repeat protein/GTPase SAR1 family protein
MSKPSSSRMEEQDSYPTDPRYPRPRWFRTGRWILIHWWLTPLIVLIVYSAISLLTQSLLNQWHFLIQHWWVIVLTVIGLIIIGLSLFGLYNTAESNLQEELQEWIKHRESREYEKQHPLGLTLQHVLRQKGFSIDIYEMGWSPDGSMLASVGPDLRIWDASTGGHTFSTLSKGFYMALSWSPNGSILASAAYNESIQLWDIKSGQVSKTFPDSVAIYDAMAWSPDGSFIASASYLKISDNSYTNRRIQLWDANTGQVLKMISMKEDIRSLSWSPDRSILAASDGTIHLWKLLSNKQLRTLKTSLGSAYTLAWSPDGSILVSADYNGSSIQIWDTDNWQQRGTLEGHRGQVGGLAFSHDGRLLASKSDDNTVRLWRTDTWEVVAVLNETYRHALGHPLAFHPHKASVLATRGENETVIRIWDLDLDLLLAEKRRKSSAQMDTTSKIVDSNDAITKSPVRAKRKSEIVAEIPVRYTNAKVILVGDSGVGKSGLGLVLTGHPFAETASTHGRFVWTFDSQAEVALGNGRKETREILLWDLAGQPSYRLIHQLYLNEVAIALVVFDSRSETDPFAGIYHWDRALRMVQRSQGRSTFPMKKFLVAARTDRGGVGVSAERISSLLNELGFAGYFETSAKEGLKIVELAETIRTSIDWNELPWVSSTGLFQQIKSFLIAEKEAGRLLSSVDDLYHSFLRSAPSLTKSSILREQFETCIRLVEQRDLIRWLSFGNLVLLQPELLDIYASALINAVKKEPDGLGSIAEQRVQEGDFFVPTDLRLKDSAQEKLLLIAMVKDLLGYEVALREQAGDGAYLVFPSQSTRDNPDLPDPQGKASIITFEGPVLNIYAKLAVRISHSGIFKKMELWKNAITYTSSTHGTYGLFLQNYGEGRAELTLFFDKTAGRDMRIHFEEYIYEYLKGNALPESIHRRRIVVCSVCNNVIGDQTVQLRLKRDFDWLNCSVCGTRIALIDREEQLSADQLSVISEMNRNADSQRDAETAKTTVQGKLATQDFDVFLCYNQTDKRAVMQVGGQLKERGILPWLDEWELRPGFPWQSALEQQIKQIKSAAVFVGKNGRGPWQDMEQQAFIRQFVKRQCPVIPVILPDTVQTPELPTFLEGMTWVDFRQQAPDPFEYLIWGITGERYSKPLFL